MEKSTLFIVSVVVGMIIGATVVYTYMSAKYYEVHTSNIGGFIFKQGKVYSLEELKDI